MARTKKQEPELPVSSTLIRPKAEVKKLLEEQIVAANPILNMQVAKVSASHSYDMFGVSRSLGDKYDEEQQAEFFRQYNIWDNRCKEIFVRSFEHPNNTDLAGYEQLGRTYFISDVVEEKKKGIRDQVAYMKGFIDRMDLIPCKVDSDTVATPKIQVDEKKVFLVHGHNEEMKQKVARIVTKLGLDPIILHEQANEGRTIIDKFETNAENIQFAIILLSADDLATSKRDLEGVKEEEIKSKLEKRARQNVVFEMGYFAGKLGRNRLFYLLQDGVAKPGDLDGLVYTPYDTVGAWKFSLVKELQACGYNVDANKVL